MSVEKPQYVAIAWTRPVNWAGFSALPRDIDAAAAQSRTIRYQRDMIRRSVKNSGGVLVHEEAILELSPDRATVEVVTIIEKLRHKYPDATFIAVEFPKADGWRPHRHLAAFFAGIPYEPVEPVPYLSAAFSFDPALHFTAWEKRAARHRQGKGGHREDILDALTLCGPLSLAAKAQALNDQGLKTHTGKAWTKDNLAKFLNTPAPLADQG